MVWCARRAEFLDEWVDAFIKQLRDGSEVTQANLNLGFQLLVDGR